ncbi:MAG: hypothetical protein A3B99_04445 [Candidatus Yanofskybacteria bacterium RIFCSPHIGHO2_02_FULL_44_12b]|uniref:Uncharacterized protein n=2 Tax=Candidatus Yanofskyibacteriota TaxID=1752733 RepID=A0A1F8GL25_9BACT|nr:MAG: hypothetical protein UW79_C0013G0030 [Candidatus Yanofskybacteria bacterium GW2011_GWA2_44_9]OGN04452.1 MAG: hypothetical protein A2659_03060 [Candidatus Yanofskybacteria bacterium RIFCSPHIGHO2_01_FULL_44_24]OGN14429.1 MAG: hypothetical protein A3B99_04445 [Candidatus Yanofskybacteria bacterium RIFCSPHIGHO2_02_FULL_44_12b]OGN25710.1 MAG: hypothetical protein A2925_00790 [Candidatus Yanofskybacteria bacterium RIFCSPLOWO2_01_FULL_44_22]
MKKIYYIFFGAVIIAVVLLPAKGLKAQASCTLIAGDWSKSSVYLEESISLGIGGSSACAGEIIIIEIFGTGGTGPFLIGNPIAARMDSSGSLTYNTYFLASEFSGRNNDTDIYFMAYPSSSPVRPIPSNAIRSASDLRVFNTRPGQVTYFDINPKTVSSTTASRNITLKVKIYRPALLDFCSMSANSFSWKLVEEITGTNLTVKGPISQVISSSNTAQDFDLSFSMSLQAGRAFYVILQCDTATAVNFAQSANVVLSVNTGAPGSGSGSGSTPIIGGANQNIDYRLKNPLISGSNDILTVGILISNWIFNIAIAIVTFLVIYAGVRFLTSRGNAQQVEAAKKSLWYTLGGLAIVLIGKGFISLIGSILGL